MATAIAGLLAALVAFPTFAQTPHFDAIEYTGDRSQRTTVPLNAMSADGSYVVGRHDDNYSYNAGFVWHNGVLTDPCANLSTSLHIPDTCQMTGVANNGAMVGWYVPDITSTQVQMVVWGPSGTGPYKPVCPNPQNNSCRSGTMATNGQFAVYDGGGWLASAASATPTYSAFGSAGIKGSGINGLNASATWLAGGQQYQDNISHPVFKYNGTACDLDPTGALGGSYANAVSDAGTFLVGVGSNATPAVWTQISSTNCAATLNTLPTTNYFGSSFGGGNANAVSADGSVIVGRAAAFQNSAGVTDKAFRWTCANGMESMEELLASAGVATTDLSYLSEARAISSDGTVIAGIGQDTNGVNPRAWRAVLPLPGTPTLTVSPSTDMLFKTAPGVKPSTSFGYALSRTAGRNLFTVTGTPAWLDVTPAATGTMSTAAQTITFAANDAVKNLAVGIYTAAVTITFSNVYCPLGSVSRNIKLIVTPTAHDFNGDAKSDIFWRNTGGSNAVWLMNGATASSVTSLGGVDTSWTVVGQRDFDGDGKTDILWRNSGGSNAIWFMNGTTVSSVSLIGGVDNSWSVVGTADLNGDGKGDIIWRNTSGTVAVWLMNGATVSSVAVLGGIGTNWSVAGTADFDGDGKGDILWRENGGSNAIWFMNGAAIASVSLIGGVGTSWTVAGTADFNGDGKGDILWREAGGSNAVWFMNGASVSSVALIGGVGTTWSVASVGDYNGDGKGDILWREQGGSNAIWQMNGATVSSVSLIGGVANNWSVMNAGAN